VAKAQNEPPSLQCERNGQLQACDEPTPLAKPKKVAAFKAQANEMNGETEPPVKKKKKKSKKTAQKKSKRSEAE